MKIKVNTSIKLNKTAIKQLEGKAKAHALEKTAYWILGEVTSSGKVPKDTGALELSGFVKVVQDELVQIVYDTPYARRWYFNTEGVEFNQSYNANATDHWLDDFVHGERQQEILEMYAAFYKEELGGLLT